MINQNLRSRLVIGRLFAMHLQCRLYNSSADYGVLDKNEDDELRCTYWVCSTGC